ncbi:hypothetical protein MKZ38_006094 [Zalerion maritima]|uniref:Pre-rRNA-processing protein RIX1 n=1 Tax=Zalerion maritima TaxID=339359 RepID=A0AAD5WWY1_9PEZI|nr:hypothetical protein MKZ38_006094 [Zalerion maritima]
MSQTQSKLRVLCGQLSSTKVEDLPRCLPNLVENVLQCGKLLSTSHDPKSKTSSQTYTLVHKLKTQISTLLNGKTVGARFSGAALAKAVIDVGGRECLQTSGPWARSLISMLQKPDPFPCEEIATAALVKIYLLVQEHQSLAREIATPTLTDFIQVCLGQTKKTESVPVAELMCSSFAMLIPMYATNFRPFSVQIRSQIRPYLAPTSSDGVLVPTSLQKAAQELMALLPHSAPKNGSSEEWSALVQGLLKSLHLTADQVFRCVDENWSTSFNYARAEVNFNHDPSGGGTSPDDLPLWIGIQAGGERLAGLLDFLATIIGIQTKAPVSVPLPSILDICSRISYITPGPSSSRPEYDPSATREEKDGLFTSLSAIHTSTTLLLDSLMSRMDHLMLPHFSEALDQAIRLFNTCRDIIPLRKGAYNLFIKLFSLGGSMLPKQVVDTLQPLILGACRDMYSAAGNLAELEREEAAKKETSSKTNPGTNVDRFLTNPSAPKNGTSSTANSTPSIPLATDKFLASSAESLLVSIYTSLPQEHLNAPLRSFMDRTSVICRSKGAMVASVLNPYPGQDGKYVSSVLPYLVQQFSGDQAVEVLRTNIQTKKALTGDLYRGGEGDEDAEMLEQMQAAEDNLNGTAGGAMNVDGDEDEKNARATEADGREDASKEAKGVEQADKPNPFVFRDPSPAAQEESAPAKTETTPASPLKRKFEIEEEDESMAVVQQPAKKEKIEVSAPSKLPSPVAEKDDGEDDDDGEVKLEMRFDSDSDSDSE